MSPFEQLTSRRSLTKVFGMEEFMDVILEVPSSFPQVSRFGCHKIKLAEASKTLKDKLLSKKLNFDENGIAYLFIDDLALVALFKVLGHIYNEEIPESEMDDELLKVARHLQMDNLVTSCLWAAFPAQLTVENVSKALETAYELDVTEMKENALKFTWDHLKEISSLESFKNLGLKTPNLMTDLLVAAKRSVLEQLESNTPKEEKEFSFTTAGPNVNEGLPVLLGIFTKKTGPQEIRMPTPLPVTARKVRIIYSTQSSVSFFVKMWSVADGVTHTHWIYAKNVNSNLQSAELVFPIDETNRKIFADTSLQYDDNDCKVTVYLTGYIE